MNLNDFNQSKYLAGRELPEGGLDLVIGGFDVVKLNDGTSKPAMSWTNPSVKPMLLNRTNRLRLEVIFRTSQTEALIGQRVGVFFDRMVQGPSGDMVGGLRLRPAGQGIQQSQAGVQTFTSGHQPNPARQVATGFQPQPAQPPTVQDVAGDWTQEVPF
jgi:hypothetical protein